MLPSGEHIPIEQRNPEEVTSVRGMTIAPVGIQAANPAFDVTPHSYVTAIITERGIVYPPFIEGLRRVCTDYRNSGRHADANGERSRANSGTTCGKRFG